MKHPLVAGLIGAALSAALVLGVQTGAPPARAEEPVKHYDRDVAEMDRTTALLVGRVHALNESLKALARKVNAQNFQNPDKQLEQQLQQELQTALAGVFEDGAVLVAQTFLLAIDNVVDTGGPVVEAAVLQELSKRTGAAAEALKERAQKERLGIGGIALGYAIARAAKVTPDEIFANKADNKSWPEVMRARQVTFAQLQAVLENKQE